MKSLLIALGLALCCFVQANEDKRFGSEHLPMIEGNWVVGVIVSNCQKMKEMFPRMPASPISFEQISADEVKMTMEMATPNGCKTMRPVVKKVNGHFSSSCGKGGKKTVGYINLKDKILMTDITISHPHGECKMATLAGRELSDIQGALKEFKAFAARYGLEGEKVHVLTTEGMCPRSS